MKLPITQPNRLVDYSDWHFTLLLGFAFYLATGNAAFFGQEPEKDPVKEDVAEEVSRETEGEWVELFDGKTLEGWVQRGGRAEFEVEDGAIVGFDLDSRPCAQLLT